MRLTDVLCWMTMGVTLCGALALPRAGADETARSAPPASSGAASSDATATPVPPEGMVLVPAGPFLMGSNDLSEGFLNPGDASPRHSVTLPAFYIDKTEVTNAAYKKYCDATGYPPPPHWKNGAFSDQEADVPVTHINWWEAQAYAAWAGKRLPTEAEWEKAARGTDGRKYPWGDSWDSSRLVWNGDEPQPVASKPSGASPYGALDMAGNVFEWVSDWYMAYPGSRAQQKMHFGTQYKVLRGGGIANSNSDVSTFHRGILPPRMRSQWAGFRCAKDVEPAGN